jgi:hypothetical protein
MLEVTSYISNGLKDSDAVPIRVLQDTWIVEAHGLEWARYWIDQIEPVQKYIFGIVAAVVATLAWFGFKGREKSASDFES